MKYLTLIITALLVLTLCEDMSAQNQQSSPNSYITYINWVGSSPIITTTSKNSFFWSITRSSYSDVNGWYYFNVHFYSDSYIWNYNTRNWEWRYTYVDGIYVYCDGGYIFENSKAWVSFREQYVHPGLQFKSKNPKASVTLYYNNYKAN